VRIWNYDALDTNAMVYGGFFFMIYVDMNIFNPPTDAKFDSEADSKVPSSVTTTRAIARQRVFLPIESTF
jgi:hypothetical protein